MPVSSQSPDLNDKTVVKGQKAPSPYKVAAFCTVGFALAIVVIVLVMLIPMSESVEMNEGELVGLSVISEKNQTLQVTVMKGSGVADLDGLFVYFDGEEPQKYSAPETYRPGTTIFYQFAPELSGKLGTLDIYGYFTNGEIIRVYTDKIKLQ
ncbi:MAG TPA: hypothetical protein O0X70_08100 [Methanocorpusculum sp.]|nr:hypothetical protein [Methanocorpusculum sp.]